MYPTAMSSTCSSHQVGLPVTWTISVASLMLLLGTLNFVSGTFLHVAVQQVRTPPAAALVQGCAVYASPCYTPFILNTRCCPQNASFRYIGAENLGRRKPAPLAAELPAGLLSWIKPVWCYSEPDVIDLCGLDVAVFFRLLQLGMRTGRVETTGHVEAHLLAECCAAAAEWQHCSTNCQLVTPEPSVLLSTRFRWQIAHNCQGLNCNIISFCSTLRGASSHQLLLLLLLLLQVSGSSVS